MNLVLSGRALAAGAPSPVLPLWTFDYGVTNQWGGRYNVYERDPSWARTYLDPRVHRAALGHSLRVTAHREKDGYCGVWMKFYPELGAAPQFLDATPFRFLSFWVKGTRGGEDFDFALTDEAHENREDPALTRHLRDYLPKGAATEWQEVSIPLSHYWRLDLRRLTTLTFSFMTSGDYRFYIDNVALKAVESAAAPASAQHAASAPDDTFEAAHGRMWVWKTRDLFADGRREEWEKFFAFCSGNRIREIYLSLDFGNTPGEAPARFDLRNPGQYREFLARAHRQGMAVQALAGAPEWADRENHPLALAAVDAVLSYNRAALAATRFDGVHFDVEPYTLVEYADPDYRQELLSDYLQMVTECLDRLRAEPALRFSCDVPAWFYPVDEEARKELTVPFHGAAKTVGEHLTDMLETVTIMDYRNEADGANGIISFGTAALNYAASKGKTIVVGLETSLEPDSTVHFVCGLPAAEFHRRLAASPLRHRSELDGFRMSAFRDGSSVHVGLEEPAPFEDAKRQRFERALVNLALQLGAAADPERFPTRPILQAARDALRDDPEWKGFDPWELPGPETQQKITGFRAIYRMPSKITFHGLGRVVFTEEARSALEWLGHYSSFAGLGFHYYETFRSLMETK